jgi:tetratricopeptide (TPR) repeat protein
MGRNNDPCDPRHLSESNKQEEDTVTHSRQSRFGALSAVVFIGVAIAMPEFTIAMPIDNPTPPSTQSAPASGASQKAKKKARQKQQKSTTSQKSSSAREFLAGYRVAYNLVYNKHKYAAGIAKLRTLGHDEHSDVATTIGYASRKLGRYDDAKYWYEKALASDPDNSRTLSYYGMWHAEQGNRLKAEDFLAKVRNVCGNTACRDYAALKSVIDGSGTY